MVTRKIVSIDEDKCDGCGLCIPACHEGAIEIVDGKARLKEEKLCDGLGDCLGECPKDAINIEVREAEEFDEEAVAREMAKMKSASGNKSAKFSGNPENGTAESDAKVKADAGRTRAVPAGGGCPSARFNNLSRKTSPCSGLANSNQVASANSSAQNKSKAAAKLAQSAKVRNSAAETESPADSQRSQTGSNDVSLSIKSQLEQWPVQLSLLPETAPIFEGADLLISADCVAHAYADFHLDLLKDRKLVIGCPKLDDNQYYIEKLTSIFDKNDINSITVAVMEVPCCGGLKYAVNQALAETDKEIPLNEIVFTVSGEKK